MSKVEFKCYVKALKSRQEPLESYEISFLKRIDKRIRNKETVRKSKKRFKEDFVSEQKKFNDLLKQYRDTVQTTYELARILKDDHKEVIQIEKVLIEKKSVWPFSDM
ncbi:BZIP domain-containing protein [Entamoeba marina]